MRYPIQLGQLPTAPAPEPSSAELIRALYDLPKDAILVPGFYTVSVTLGGAPNASAASSAALRPERFICRRITYATTGDCLPYVDPVVAMSQQGRSVEVTWQDEFTRFTGQQPSLVAAIFGDSNGFLDLPEGVLFQGRQTLQISLRRLFWPSAEEADDTRWDFVFAGLSILPSGSRSVSGGL